MSTHASRQPQSARQRRHAPTTGDENFRQLRHQTKNTLQRLLSIIGTAPELRGAGKAALRDSLQRRIVIAADLSDALFGFQSEPGDLRDRLQRLCLGIVEIMAEEGACIAVGVSVEGPCPPDLHDSVVRVAHELVCNAVKHGMYQRVLGTIEVELRSTNSATKLVVSDDGWGCGRSGSTIGEGLSLVRLLLHPNDGSFTIARCGEHTVATAAIPHIAPAGEQTEAADTPFAAAMRGSRYRGV